MNYAIRGHKCIEHRAGLHERIKPDIDLSIHKRGSKSCTDSAEPQGIIAGVPFFDEVFAQLGCT